MADERVSVAFFVAVEKALRKANRGKSAMLDQKMINRWIQLLGQVEREYREAVATESGGD